MDALTMVAEQGVVPVTHHLVSDRSVDLSEAGKARAVCGRVFLPAALAAPLGRPCPLCEAVVARILPLTPDSAAAGARRT